MTDAFGVKDNAFARGGFFSPVKRRMEASNVNNGIVVSPDKKAALDAAAAAAENVLENDVKKQPITAARHSPLRVSSTATTSSPRTSVLDEKRKRTATPTKVETPTKKRIAPRTPSQQQQQQSQLQSQPTPTPVAVPVAQSSAAAADESIAANLAQTCHDAQLELEVSKRTAAKDEEIDRLERELFHALFLAIKLALAEQRAKFNCKHDATDLLASARRQNIPFNSGSLTTWIDLQLRMKK